MKKEIMFTMMVICFSALALATYYPGQTVTFDNEFETTKDIGYVIVGNSHPVPNLDMDIEKEEITITFPSDMRPDTFSIVFVEREVREVEVEVEEIIFEEVVTIKYENRTVEVPIIVSTNDTIQLQAQINNVTDNVTAETQPMINNSSLKMKVAIGVILSFVAVILLITFMILRNRKNNDTVPDPFAGVDMNNPKSYSM